MAFKFAIFLGFNCVLRKGYGETLGVVRGFSGVRNSILMEKEVPVAQERESREKLVYLKKETVFFSFVFLLCNF